MAFDMIPQELKDRNQWVLWKIIQRDGKETKIPFQPNGTPARPNDPTTWHSFDECLVVVNKFKGLGYVFSEGDPYCGIDFDACFDPETKKITDWARTWIGKLKSYSEVSPSGTGVKVWVRAKFPFGNGKKTQLNDQPRINGKVPGIECYDHLRYFAVTGQRLSGLSEVCENRQEELNGLYEYYFRTNISGTRNERERSSDISIIDRAGRYLARIPGAVSGEGGHNQTFKAACILIHGFNLGQGEAFLLLAEWNKSCQPPWSDKELRHKIESADQNPGNGERGYLIRTRDEEWDHYELPQYVEERSTNLALVVDNTKLKLSEEARERIAIMEESSPDGHAFMLDAEGMYRLTIPKYGVVVEIDRLRRESNELIGELVVKCGMPGVRSFDGVLAAGDLNVSSVRARLDRARYLALRTNFGAKEDHIDWLDIVEEFCQRVILDERKGQAAISMKEIELGDNSSIIRLPGIVLPARHPTILFGDGGAAKSYTALYFAGLISQLGKKVALFDWELAGEDHRERLEMLFPDGMPDITYARCERGIVHEVDRLRRIVKENEIEYCFYDSVAFACGGRPEEAEIAGAYFRAVRQICSGGTHIAHVNKSENADQKPFGSSFWHNGARATWYVSASPDPVNDKVLNLGLFNRKANLTKIQKQAGFRIEFQDWQTIFTPQDPAGVAELAPKMTLGQRIKEVLKNGSLTPEEIASSTGIPVKRVGETAKRNPKLFIVEGGKISNLYRGEYGSQL